MLGGTEKQRGTTTNGELPNITGSWSPKGTASSYLYGGGNKSLYTDSITATSAVTGGSVASSSMVNKLNLDASKSSSIYKNVSKVKPFGIFLPYIIKY